MAPSVNEAPPVSPVPAKDFGGSDWLDFINCLGVALGDDLFDAVLAARGGLAVVPAAADLTDLAAGFLEAATVPRRAVLAADFAAVLVEVLEGVLAEVLADVLAVAGFLAGALRPLGDGLEDFLRVFLDIRLPFVAFRRSTIRVLRVLPLTVGFAPVGRQVL